MARRSPDMLTFYLCWFCNERITWGEIVRILRRDFGDWAFMEREQYGHLACVRQVMRAEVPLAFARHRPFKARRSVLTLQRPSGPVRAPSFEEESVPVHRRCINAARAG